jgi:hypothetical protein
MPTLGTQNIATSYLQLLKADTLNPISATLQAITSGDSSGTSALALSTTEVQSTGSFTVSSNSRLLGPVTFGSTITASTGTSTIGTLSVGTQSVGTSTIGISTVSTLTVSTANLPLQLGNITFGSNITASTGTATIGTLSASTATISTASIPTILGAVTFGSNITASTGTATIGTESVNVSTIASATFGTARITGSTGGVTAFNYGTAAFTGATLQDLDSITTGSNITTGTFTVSGAAIGDIVLGGLNSLSSSSGTAGLGTAGARMMSQFRVEGANVIRYTILNTDTVSHGTIPAGTLYATAMRFIA